MIFVVGITFPKPSGLRMSRAASTPYIPYRGGWREVALQGESQDTWESPVKGFLNIGTHIGKVVFAQCGVCGGGAT